MIATRVDNNADSDSESEIGATTTGRSASIDLAHAESEAGDYEIIEVLGKGGMGDVLLAEQRRLQRSVAIKVVRHGNDNHRLTLFGNESKVTAALDHPVVIPVHDAADDFLVMRRIDGRTLAEAIAETGPADLPDLIEVVLQVAECLAFAHHRGVLHRDIKPANIMIGQFGEVYLLDWGLALAYRDPVTELTGMPRTNIIVNLFGDSGLLITRGGLSKT